ncbi:MAG: TlpA disulfide reductase family protein [Bacteroidota bacterium]
MIPATKTSVIIAILALFTCSFLDTKAQVVLVDSAIARLQSRQNFSYRYVNKRKDFSADTVINSNKHQYLKAPADTLFGYLFKLDKFNETEKYASTVLYNGKTLLAVNPGDSTYSTAKVSSIAPFETVLGNLNWIKNFAKKSPAKLRRANDTIINGVGAVHLVLHTYDTVINKEHFFTAKHLFIDKLSGLPSAITTISRNNNYGNGISNYYDQIVFSDYRFNQPGINATSFELPNGFHLPKPQPEQPKLLAPGTVAPNWTLSTVTGAKISLAQLKGKFVLLDFYFIGCLPCMKAIAPLNRIYEKYKDKNIHIASVTGRDSPKAALAFKKQYGIKYAGYAGAADVVRSYHVIDFPTYYLINKEGKIAEVLTGYTDDFEGKMDALLQRVLAQK